MDAKRAGDVVEEYRILSEIGRGAASIIYLAQEEKTKRIYALKHLAKDTPKDQRFLDQAEAEYKIAKAFDHPNIRRIERLFKIGKLLNTRELYLVMELVDGVAMDTAPPKTFEQACVIFEQTARGMAHMHERGYVHADMKPNNIILSDQGRAKIIDLGQSCKIGTVKPRIQGTPDYIAPEQVHRRPITPATDVYNLGASMYWILTREHIPTALAKGDSLMGSLDDNLIRKPKPACELNPRIPEKLGELIMECVEVHPQERPMSMGEVADRLNLIHGILLARQTPAPSVADDDEED